MKALFVAEIGNPETGELGRLKLEEVPIPEPRDEEVRIKVAYAAICGSDIHTLRGALGPMTELVRSRLPMPVGHEISGIIDKVGPIAAEMGFQPGDRVTANYVHPCGSCYYCHTGRENFCIHPDNRMNGMREYVCWHMTQVHKLPNDANLKTAALTEPLSIAFGAVEQAKVRMGSRVAVFGGGGIGQMAAQLARMAGASKVVVIEPVEEKRQLAIDLGATATLDSMNNNLVEQALELTDGMGFDSVIEASGASSAAALALKVLAKDGNVVYFSMYNPAFELPVNLFSELYLSQKHIHGMYTTADLFPRVISLLDKINLDALIQKEYPLSAYTDAFNDQLSGNYAKIVFKMD